MMMTKAQLRAILDNTVGDENQPIMLRIKGIESREFPLDVADYCDRAEEKAEGALYLELNLLPINADTTPLSPETYKWFKEKESGCGCNGGACSTASQMSMKADVAMGGQYVYLAPIDKKELAHPDEIRYMRPEEAEGIALSLLVAAANCRDESRTKPPAVEAASKVT